MGEVAGRSPLLISRRITDHAAWNAALATLPGAHILQTWEWGEFKRVTTGWTPHRLAFYDGDRLVAMASIGVRRIAGVPIVYAPKAPMLADADRLADVLIELERFARRRGALWLKLDPDVIAATGVPGEPDDAPNAIGDRWLHTLRARGWQYSSSQVQFQNTITLDLTPSEDALLAAMSQTTRRKIRLAEREGVTIRDGTLADLPLLYDLYKQTGERDQFLIRPPAYYQLAWRSFMETGLAHALIAEYDGVALAHVILMHVGQTCWYFYGASSESHRDKMPNYALQWHAIRWAKGRGYRLYDFWGAPDRFDESDRLWGVYGFKRGFRGEVHRHIGAWDYAPFPPLYALATHSLPRVLRMLRRR